MRCVRKKVRSGSGGISNVMYKQNQRSSGGYRNPPNHAIGFPNVDLYAELGSFAQKGPPGVKKGRTKKRAKKTYLETLSGSKLLV